jgi:hypothetical protein
VVERDRGQNGHFAAWTHLSELTNGANLTDYGRNGFGVKKIWLSGLDVQPNFVVACVSNASFLMVSVSKSLSTTGGCAADPLQRLPTLFHT